MIENLQQAALEYHRTPKPGKLEITATKPLTTQRDLALAYSPGVAAACEAIKADPREARSLTARGNLVAVITNGTAVLGLGNIGPLAAKPVMEGKAVLFKKFAGIDVFDIEVDQRDPDKLVEVICALEPTFGGINLEDIKAPECFDIERKCRERMKIPVFHDDQHGTAIIVGAAVTNGLKVVGKRIEDVKLVASGAGAAALACLDMLVALGMRPQNIIVTDIAGVVYTGRKEEMDSNKARYAVDTKARTLNDVIDGADVFLGLSAGRVLKPEMVARMAGKPLILALANPVPEILPEEARAVRPDAVIATGRSDYPNQVNNVLCFPFIFRGALDVGATTINEAMKIAAVHAIAQLAQAEGSDVVATAYGEESASFGADNLIPKPFDPRLLVKIAPAVARAAMDSGVAQNPITDWNAYCERLNEFVYQSGLVMKPVFAKARAKPMRVIYSEGEEERVLRAVQVVVDEKLAQPILIGRPFVIEQRIERLGLRLKPGQDFVLVNPDDDYRYKDYWQTYHRMMERRGVTMEVAKREMRKRASLIGAMMLHKAEGEALLCGGWGDITYHLRYLLNVIPLRKGVTQPAAMNMLLHPRGTFFICDTYVNDDPSATELAEITLLAAEEVRRFGLAPRVALVSHSNFGTRDSPSARKMRETLTLVTQRDPALEIEGEMHADAALSDEIRNALFPNSRLKGRANLLIMPNIDAANIAFNLVKVLGDGITVGPIMLGLSKPAHVMSPTATVRRIVNMTALAAVDAQEGR